MVKKIKLAFDISQTGKNKAGCGFFAHAMISSMLKNNNIDFTLLPHFGDFYHDRWMPSSNPYSKGHYGPAIPSKSKATQYWHSKDLEKKLGNPDIVHSNNFWCPTNITRSRLIYTLYDLGFLHNPQWTSEENRIGCFEGVLKASSYADWIISISEYSKNHFLKIFPHFPEERIEVIYPCSRFENTQVQKKQPKIFNSLKSKQFWLSVGTIEPRKNQKFLVTAYQKYLQAGGVPYPLVLAGQTGWLMDDFEAFIEELGIRDNVILTAYVDDEELLWLYQNCFVNLYPSLFEGFGLPVLEGMQFGAATITTRDTSMVEITGENALLLAPDDLDGWVMAMQELSKNTNFVQSLALKAQNSVQKFGANKISEQLENLYFKVMQYNNRVR